eukprot:4436200-Pleurochrysis_carterae.AAC.1
MIELVSGGTTASVLALGLSNGAGGDCEPGSGVATAIGIGNLLVSSAGGVCRKCGSLGRSEAMAFAMW